MRISVAGLKNIDYKQTAIDHGEKVFAAFLGLFVLFALITTNWIPYKATPQELSKLAEDYDKLISKSTWPAQEQQNFAAMPPLRPQVVEMISPIENASRLEWPIPMFWPVIPQKEPAEEPEWETAGNLLADAGRAILTQVDESGLFDPTNPLGAEGQPGELFEVPEEDQIPEDFLDRSGRQRRRNRNPLNLSGAFGQRKGIDLSSFATLRTPDAGEDLIGRGRNTKGWMKGFGMREDEDISDLDYGAARGGSEDDRRSFAGLAGHGRRFVSIRGVFRLRRQLDKIAKAMHDLDQRSNVDNVKFYDFEIQRQKALPGDNPWSGKWETVNTQEALDVLDEVSGYDSDLVDTRITDPVITMPLPARGYGYWGRHATHPDVEKYVLTGPEDQALNDAINRIVISEEERRKEYDAESTAFVKGFSTRQHSARNIRRKWAAKEGRRVAEEVWKQFDRDKLQKDLLTYIQSKLNAVDRLLLFRYFDFGVEQGETYRYRVRFQMGNPNFDKDPSQVVDPSVAEGATRWTDYSEPTKPVEVPPDFQFFLENVELTTANGRSHPHARINLFYWYPDVGTVINETLNTDVGQTVGGNMEALVLDPVKATFEPQKVQLLTNTAIVDISENPQIDKSMHADLELKTLTSRRVGIAPRALSIDRNGRLTVLDGASQEQGLAKAKKRLEFERAAFMDLQEGFDDVEDDDHDGGLDDWEDEVPSRFSRKKGRRGREDDRTTRRGKTTKRRKANPIRKKGKKGKGKRKKKKNKRRGDAHD